LRSAALRRCFHPAFGCGTFFEAAGSNFCVMRESAAFGATRVTGFPARGRGEVVAQSPAPARPKRPEKGMVHGIAPDELVRLAPKLKPYLRRSNPTWPDLIDAADWLRHDLGVSKPLWGDACLAMGRELAAVALAIVSTKARASERDGVLS
jgi:hypothetical protein